MFLHWQYLLRNLFLTYYTVFDNLHLGASILIVNASCEEKFCLWELYYLYMLSTILCLLFRVLNASLQPGRLEKENWPSHNRPDALLILFVAALVGYSGSDVPWDVYFSVVFLFLLHCFFLVTSLCSNWYVCPVCRTGCCFTFSLEF